MMDRDKMLGLLAELVEEGDEIPEDDLEWVTLKELSNRMGKAGLTHAERRHLQRQIEAGKIEKRMVKRKDNLGRIYTCPGYRPVSGS